MANKPKVVKAFVNEQTVDIEAAGMKGTVTIPVMMTDSDLATYLSLTEKNVELINNWKEDQPPLLRVNLAWTARKHLVRAIDFPGAAIDNFRNGDKPFPVLVHVITPLLDPLIDDALNLPKS